ncbi:C40 family peptidase [Streptacidiphilus sp. PAMC 29251]
MPVLRETRLRLARRALLPAALGALLVGGFAASASASPAPIDLNSASCPANMVQGEDDGCVTQLQTLLDTHGFSLSVDGDFGAGTVAAVRTFQSETGIAVDGQVGPQTKGQLYVSSTSVPDPVNLLSAQCPTSITQGEDDGCVTELQELLDAQGARVSVDGDFGSSTLAAVKSFQTAHGLGVDGQAGPQTKSALYGTAGTPSPAINLLSSQCPTNITQGEQDGCVTTLQSLLDAHGAAVTVDGTFGANTLAAVRTFQSAQGLGVDGQVGPLTKAALYRAVSTAPGAPSPIPLDSSSCPTSLTEGEHDGCVTTLQSFLNSWGAHLSVDGDFGAHTFTAVESFQAAHGLGVDGQVGPQTKAVIAGGGAYPCPSSGCPGQGTAIQPYVVIDAKKMVAAGNMPYAYAGGHGRTPGPSLGQCVPPDAGYVNGVCEGSHTVGLDCSGFARLMYSQAAGYDVLGSGNTDSQLARGTLVAVSKAVPGDLVFFGKSTTDTDHVGIYAGVVNGVPEMYNAFETGTYVREEPISDANDSSHPLLGYYHYSATVAVPA